MSNSQKTVNKQIYNLLIDLKPKAKAGNLFSVSKDRNKKKAGCLFSDNRRRIENISILINSKNHSQPTYLPYYYPKNCEIRKKSLLNTRVLNFDTNKHRKQITINF